MIIFQNKLSTVEYDAEREMITYLQHGITKKKLLLEQLEAVLKFSKTSPVTSVIADIRNQLGSFKSVFNFLDNEYYPTLKSRGLICKTFIVNEDIINNFLANEIISGLNKHGIEAAIFSDSDLASEWINNQVKMNIKNQTYRLAGKRIMS